MKTREFAERKMPAGSKLRLAADDELICPACKQKADGVKQMAQTKKGDPEPLTLCGDCGHLGIYRNGKIHTLVGDELKAVMRSGQGPEIQKAQRSIRIRGPINFANL